MIMIIESTDDLKETGGPGLGIAYLIAEAITLVEGT